MPLGSVINSLRLLAANLDSKKATAHPVKNRKNDKPLIFPSDEKINFLPRDNPSNHGYSEEYIDSYFREIDSDLTVRFNRALIIKDNVVIAERYLSPYRRDCWDCIFSSSKTITALALGILYDQHKIELDKPAYKYLKINPAVSGNKKITIRHLLTNSTGNTFNEMISETSKRWVKDFFDSNYKFKPGTKFEYNSLNTYILSAIIEKVSGQKFEDFIKENVLNHLNCNSIHFDCSPEGIFKGGWGVYILPEDLAKLGILVKDYGVYNSKRIISEEWIKMMSEVQYPAREFERQYDYGFQMWVGDNNRFCAFNGMFDQNVFIYRDTGVVVVMCCGDNEAFHGTSVFPVSEKYFAKPPKEDFKLCNLEASHTLMNYDNLMYHLDYILNKEYIPTSKVANSVGILPVILQNELGKYAKGIKSVKILKEDDYYVFNIIEGNLEFNLKFNFKEGIRQTLNIYGNVFDCSCDAKFILSGRGDPLLYIRLAFLEFSSTRYFSIKFSKNPDDLSLELSENPGVVFVNSLVEAQDPNTRKFIKGLIKIINPNTFLGMIKNVFSPAFNIVYNKQEK